MHWLFASTKEFYSALFMSILFLVPIMAVPIAPQAQDPKDLYLMHGGLPPDEPKTPNVTNATTNASVQHVEEADHGHIHDDPYPIKGTLFVHPSLFEVGTPPELRNVMKNAIESMLEPIIPDILAVYEQNRPDLKLQEPPTRIPLIRIFKNPAITDMYDFRLTFSKNRRTYFGHIDKKCLILEKEDNNKVSFEFQPELLTGKMGEDARLKNRLLVSFMDGKTVDVTRNTGLLSYLKSKTKGKNQGSS